MYSLFHRLQHCLRQFGNDRAGAVLFYITATLPALVGFSLLAIDASRLMTLHTSLQKGVDSLAIAAAGELDRFPGAMARANVAVANLIENSQMFGQGDATIDESNVTLRFFSALPANDSDPMPSAGATLLNPNTPDDDFDARFVEVTVDPFSLNTIFPASFLGGADGAVSSATAVAGNDVVACKLAPLFICNPYEPDSNTNVRRNTEIVAAAASRSTRRQQIRMRQGPGSGSYGSGNYGYLDMGNGASALARALAVGDPETCFVQNGVDTETGQKTGPVENAVNVRFGLYPQSMNGIGIPGNPANNWDVRPAKNVRKGQDQDMPPGKICKNYSPEASPADGMPLPRDPCFAAAQPCEWMGNGGWDADIGDYWSANMPDSPSAPLPADVLPSADSGFPAQSWKEVTRYDIFNYEVDQAYTDLVGDGGEFGNPTMGAACYSGPSVATDTIERRIINGAILNCKALAVHGNNLNGHQTGVPVAAFAEFFITEPLEKGGSGTAGDIYSEIVRVVVPGASPNTFAFDQVQLYR